MGDRTAPGLFDDVGSDYTPRSSSRWTQPWSQPSARAMTAVGALLVGFLLVAGVVNARNALEAADARKSSLVALVQVRQARAEALGAELEELRRQVAAAEADASGGLEVLTTRLARAEASAGLTAVTGPGVRATFADATRACPTQAEEDCRIQDVDLQLAVNTLFGLGAEAIAVNGERLIGTTAIRSAGGSILVNYRVLTSPYVVEAIGNPGELERDFSESTLALDFAAWRDSYGLGFSIERVTELDLPPYGGSIRLRAARPEAEDAPA